MRQKLTAKRAAIFFQRPADFIFFFRFSPTFHGKFVSYERSKASNGLSFAGITLRLSLGLTSQGIRSGETSRQIVRLQTNPERRGGLSFTPSAPIGA